MNIAAIRPRKIAVVGSGVSGLGCAWLLNKAHDVTLYEKDDRLGGHANTVTVKLPDNTINVDTGFIVFNPVNYPNLVNLFETLNVDTCDTDMSFAVSMNNGALEYSGSGLSGVFAQKRNLFKPGFWVMISDLLRFYRESSNMAAQADINSLTLGDLLKQHGYGERFIYDHLLPMGSAIWSTPVDEMLNYPASSFMRFCQNHGLVQLKDRPQWRTVIGGSHCYVERIGAELEGKIRLNSRIHRIIRRENEVIIEDMHGRRDFFDDVVLACHSDQALKLLEAPTADERNLLGQFPYLRNQAFLHTDRSLMPERDAVWSSWNYMAERSDGRESEVSVSYWMNRLQPLDTETQLFVSLNPLREPAEGTILRTFFYDHPQFGKNALANQKMLWSLQGKQNTWFCGAYFGYGFHEDGLQAGLAVAEQLGGIPRPWVLDEPNTRIHVQPAAPSHMPNPVTQQEQANG
ncbi:NAD(P)/FAD-dependent oxidoreductase [Pontibacterium granulatum]|uniref:NAD(P)/FAD-dependent oxidoreductase n=1 Tax=Pontibacterium granulatum TaxID=2036029 RepID=UPI00249BAC14|nr:FAD-dependent oxidoreductase [Pontibacterium granulatum]